MNHITIGIIGARVRNSQEDFEKLAKFLEEYLSILDKAGSTFSFVSGGCPKGGDHFAEIIAEQLNIPIKIHYPKVEGNSRGAYGKACYARNILIAKDATELIALVSPERKGGTEHTIRNYIKMKNKNPILI